MDLRIDPLAYIHPAAYVVGSAVGARSKVWQFASVIRGAVIGEWCVIASGACIDGSRVGNRTKIAHNVAAGPGFRIGEDCFIGPNVTLCNDAWPRAHVEGFDVAAYEDRPCIIIENGASIGAGAVILPGVRIGEGAMIAAGSTVTREVPPGMLWDRDGSLREIANEGNIPRVRFASRAPSLREFLKATGIRL